MLILRFIGDTALGSFFVGITKRTLESCLEKHTEKMAFSVVFLDLPVEYGKCPFYLLCS